MPRRPEDSPLYRVVADHFEALERVHEERFEPTHGALRPAARRAAGRLLDCGLLEHGFARVRCRACRAEFLVAFRCKGRQFCPSCHARRLAEWSLWLDEELLAPVAHRQVVLTVPKRLRAYFIHDRRRLGMLSRIATRTLRAYVQASLGGPACRGCREAVPGLIVCVQTFGSVAHFHPHLHVVMTDGAFRRDGTFVALREPDAAVLESLWQRAVLAAFVRHGWLEPEAAAAMLGWPHSGFGAYVGPRISERQGVLRVARYSARAPIAESRLRYDAARGEVELVADRVEGPYAGVHRMTALEFLARWVDHVPDHYEVRVRYAGAYATRRRVWWRQRGVTLTAAPALETPARAGEPAWPALRARRRRWAELLRLVFKVEVEVCPRCGGEAGIVAFVTAPQAVRRMLEHQARRGVEARAGPWAEVVAAE
ncbi:MAG: transposase [Gammaproteobacteria bacterium]|nr:transposase [Gammaproteobacteria bacterium]